jgi:hypothetical protein
MIVRAKTRDPERTELLNKLSITEVWFSNLEVLNDIWAMKIKSWLCGSVAKKGCDK